MIVVVLLSLTPLGVLVTWVTLRHRASSAWSRELEDAFHTDERRELSRHRLF